MKKKNTVFNFFIEHREAPLIIVLIVLLIAVNIRIPGYLSENYTNILKNCSLNLVMATGMLCVLLIGSIDISVAAILELSAAIAGVMMRDGLIESTFLMFVVGIAIGALIGLVTGILISYGRVLPIIVTLGMTYFCRALIPMEFILGMNKIARIGQFFELLRASSHHDRNGILFILESLFSSVLYAFISLAITLNIISIMLRGTSRV